MFNLFRWSFLVPFLILTWRIPQAHSEIGVGLTYVRVAYDYGYEKYEGVSPTGSAAGLSLSYKWNPWSAEIFVRRAAMKRKFVYNQTDYLVELNDFYWGGGVRKSIFIPELNFKVGLSFHQFSSVLNGLSYPTDNFSDEVLRLGTGSYMAYYFGIGWEYELFSKFTFFTDGTFFKFQEATLYEWILGFKYSF